MKHLILASASPRRQELLRGLGLQFDIRTADIDESMDPSRGAAAEVARISREKALAVQKQSTEDAVIIAADTIVCVDDRILGQPHTEEEAAEMLHLLSGRVHQVRTGVTVLQGNHSVTEVETAEVHFRPLSDAEIAAYIATSEPMDKAGAYGIQGRAAIFVEGICGDYFNVMGLPLCRLSQILEQFGIAVLGGAEMR